MEKTHICQTKADVGHHQHRCSDVGHQPGNGDNGNVFQIVNNRDTGRTQSFTYDPLNRISTAQSQATNGATCWGQSFVIDAWGNLTNTSVTKCSALSQNTPAAANNQISGYCYDKAGNLLGTSPCPGLPYTPTYTYDGENRLKTAGGVTYTYDGDGNRVQKSNGTLYWGSGPLAESDLSGTAASWREYVFFNDKRVARSDASNGTVHYYFSNHLASTSVIASSTGTPEEDVDYAPYGGIAYGTSADHYLFTGKERDSETGFDYFGARYYGAGIGRWLSPDWAARATAVPYADFGDPQTLNLYGYVRNNPLFKPDLDGHGCPPVCPDPTMGLKDAVRNLPPPNSIKLAWNSLLTGLGINAKASVTASPGGITQVSSSGEKSYKTPGEPWLSAEITVSKAGAPPADVAIGGSVAHGTVTFDNRPGISVGATTETTPSISVTVPKETADRTIDKITDNIATALSNIGKAVQDALTPQPAPPPPPPQGEKTRNIGY